MNPNRIPGYRVGEELGHDELHLLLRAVREADGASVLVKCPSSWPPSALALAALRREVDVLGALAGEGIPVVLTALPDALVLRDGGGLPLPRLLAGQPLAIEAFLVAALRLVGVVGRLHEAGFTHRGLRTASVLATRGTLELELVDWSTVSRLTEDAEGVAPGRAAHRCLSPEQTGRMNRGVDHRADFYALGAIFYELLTGRPPFETADALELAHWHIARTPVAPALLDPRVPGWLSRVTMKLLAKMAEDRYQSARGLLADLQRFDGAAAMADVALGSDDGVERFAPPQRLYGRERELAELTDAYELAAAGETSLVMVGGGAGVGKTAVVSELGRLVAARRGRFIVGKFDQLDQGRPYAGLAQALRQLCRQLVTDPETARARELRVALGAALGPNVGVLNALVPELEALVGCGAGCGAPSSPLGPAEAQNRLGWAFQELLGVLADSEPPLVLFLDDVQWADLGTLRLLSTSIDRGTRRPLVWILAFRDGEVSGEHPLARFRMELRQRGVALRELTLAPLRLRHLQDFLADAFGGPDSPLAGLAALLLEKTDGNPFFVIQFLRSLEKQGLVSFDRAARRWRCEPAEVHAAGLTDNVIELMTRKLAHLPERAREAVAVAAYLGATFSLETLALVRERSQREVAAELWDAVAEALVRPLSGSYEVLSGSDSIESAAIEYRFSHDRVQQAAYALIAPELRPALHLRIGRLLWRRDGGASEQLLETVAHLNRGRALIEEAEERRRLAELNLAAGRRARAAGALQRALELFLVGRALAADDPADELGWSLALDAAECQLVCARTEDGLRALDEVVARAPSADLVAEAMRIRVVHHEDAGDFAGAVRVGLEALERFDEPMPASDEARAVLLERELDRIESLLAGRPIAALAQLPRMAAPAPRRVAKLLVAMWPSAFLVAQAHLTSVLSARLVRLSLEHGNTEESAIGYITHGITVNVRAGDYRRGNEFGLVGLAVNEAFGDLRLRAKAHHLYGSFLAPWAEPLPSCRRHGREAHLAGVASGDFTYAGRAAFMETWYGFFPGTPLDGFEAQALPALAFLDRIGHQAMRQAAQILVQWGRALQGRTTAPTSLSGEGFDEGEFEQRFAQVPVFLGFLGVAQLGLAVLFGEARRAWALTARGAAHFGSSAEQLWHSVFDFYRGLAAAEVLAEEPEAARVLDAAIERLGRRAEACATNFEGQHLLLEAERAAATARPVEAAALFSRAVEAADRSGFLNDRALVAERRARFEASRGDAAAGGAYLTVAIARYRQWVATAKVRQLEARQRVLLGPGPDERAGSLPSYDAESALKAAQAITEEIDLDRLLPRLIRIVIENAGAERGVLLEASGGGLTVLAEGSVQGAGGVGLPVALAAYAELPSRLVARVLQAQAAEVIADARLDPEWRSDEYVKRRQPRAILCVPIVRQGVARGVLYLENTLVPEVFSSARAGVVEILASQAAISLENARLYQSMKEEVRRRGEAEAALTRALADLEGLKNRLQAENVYLQEEIRTQHNFDEIVGQSPALLETLRKVEKVAPTDSTVLVLGETGTGKELVARAIHHRSRRRDRPLVKVNCAAIATGLVESELFGHTKGAFTGALQKRVGRFELADGGTIFLDEIGELPLDTQAKLLRVLQEQEFEPVGSSQTRPVNVRVIAATNRDLEEAVKAGRFRADLLYRLDVFPVELPPLRRRREDIPVLASFFLDQVAKRLGTPLVGFRREDLERLKAWSWPGNVRELQNVVERAAILAQDRMPTLDAALPALGGGGPEGARPAEVRGEGRAIEEVERAHIISVLRSTAWVVEGVKGAASILRLHPNTLRSRMKKLGITRAPAAKTGP